MIYSGFRSQNVHWIFLFWTTCIFRILERFKNKDGPRLLRCPSWLYLSNFFWFLPKFVPSIKWTYLPKFVQPKLFPHPQILTKGRKCFTNIRSRSSTTSTVCLYLLWTEVLVHLAKFTNICANKLAVFRYNWNKNIF